MIKQAKKWYVLTENGSPVSISEKSYNLDRQGNEWQEVEVIPAQSVQAVAEEWRKAAEANQENDPLYTGAIIKSGAEERTYWDGRAAAFSEAADQLTSLCKR